jgi:serine/threonine-protein kinase
MGVPEHDDSEPAMSLDAELEAEEHIRTSVAPSISDVTRAVSRPDLVAASSGPKRAATLLGMPTAAPGGLPAVFAPAPPRPTSTGASPPVSANGLTTPPSVVATPTSGPAAAGHPAAQPSGTRSDPGVRLSRPLAELPVVGQYGRFALLGRIAFGGMAEIFLARETPPGGATRHLVVKRILPHVADDEGFVTMFLDEARLAMRLSHPNICHIYEFGEQDGTWFIAMEWVNGVPLGKLIRKARAAGGIPVPIAVKVIAGIAEALHYAHRARDEDGTPLEIVHRDVSPQNIMIGYQGAVKLLDFGVAKASTHATKTQAGVVKGKLAYMAPEQCRGEEIDARVDVFALGVCLYESISGRPLYHRQNEFETLKAVMDDPVPSLRAVRPELDPALDAIVMRALAKTPEERFQSAGELQEALEGWLADQRIVVNAARIAEFLQDLYAEEIARGPVLSASPGGVPMPKGASAQYLAPAASAPSAVEPGVAMRGPQDAPARPDETTGPMARPGRARASRGSSSVLLAVLGGLGLLVVAAGLGIAWWLVGRGGAVPAAAPSPGSGAGRADTGSAGPGLASAHVAAGGSGPDVGLSASDPPGVAPGPQPGAADPERGLEVAPVEPLPGTGDARPARGGRGNGGGGAGAGGGTVAGAGAGGGSQATGSLSINTRPWSKVYVGSRLLGTTPIGAAEVRAGDVVLRLVDRDGNTHRRTVRVAPGERASAFFDLQEGP